MAKVKVTETEILFRCPKCGQHRVPKTRWKMTGTVDNPTLAPSLKETVNPPSSKDYRPGIPTTVCHVVVENGILKFGNDCTHDLAGKHVPMEDFVID